MSKITALQVATMYEEYLARLGVIHDRMSCVMDIASVNEEFNMDWDALSLSYQKDGGDAGHDLAGIYRHLDRSTYPGKMGGCFVPRFSRGTKKGGD